MIFERKQRYSIFEIYRFLSYTNTGYDLALAEHYDNRFVLWHPHTLTGGRRIFKFPIRHRSMPGEGKRETLFPFSRPIKSTLFLFSLFFLFAKLNRQTRTSLLWNVHCLKRWKKEKRKRKRSGQKAANQGEHGILKNYGCTLRNWRAKKWQRERDECSSR